MSHVFISYDHDDDEFIQRLIAKVQSAGVSFWKDSHSLHAGEDWRAKIEEAIKAAFALIVVITPASKASEYVSYEWACGFGAGVKVIPILLRSSELPQRLASMHYLDFTNPQQEPWKTLIQELQKAAGNLAEGSGRTPSSMPAVVRKAVDALDSLDVEEQAKAVKALAQIDHPSAREALADAAQHASREVRIRAALELSRFKDPRAVPGLIDAQRWWQLRWEFVRRITPIGEPAVPALTEALGDQDAELREYAALALGEIGQKAAVPALLKLVVDPVAAVREAAANALEKMGHKVS